MAKCPDCDASPGERHVGGCDVTRCTLCGFQLIGCDCDGGGPTVWEGVWPGEEEVKKYGLADLNELRSMQGALFSWNREKERWYPRGEAGPGGMRTS